MIIHIMRGLPGSGKSTYAWKHILNTDNKEYLYISADDYFKCGTYYCWKQNLLHQAHLRCQELFRYGIDNKVPLIIIDNTNISNQAYKKYVNEGIEAGYEIKIHNLYDSSLTDEELFKRNQHNVPLETIKDMRLRYNQDNYYGKNITG